MAWTDITRLQHNRDHLRYPTDLTDREWAVLAPLIPPAKPGGRPRKTNMREVVNAILYIAGSGSQWRALPKDFPPVSTVRGYFYGWRDIGLWFTWRPELATLQMGAPLDLYDRPANKFVAGFIGSPKMNLIEGEAAARHDATTIGVRPEHIEVVEDGEWHGRVGVAEHLGSDTFLHVHDTGLADIVTVRSTGEIGLRHGDRVSLRPRPEQIHRFDASGLRMA
mgnify:CR=1 FL=1